MTAQNQARVHLKVEGRVQGVYFRAATLEQARRWGIKGWVMNCPDGSVEVAAEGFRTKLEELILWCRQGPPGAYVREVTTEWKDFIGEFPDFRIKR
jgi:acylphosphatase